MSAATARRRGPAIFVFGLWTVMLAGVLTAIALWGRDLPMSEDWIMVAPLTGNEPNMLPWLWAQNNEHRMPLPRLVYLIVLKVSGGDFRSGMVFNALALGAVSLAMILVAKRLRGGTVHYADAVFALLLLNLGHYENLLWGWQIQFSVSVGLTCALLLVVASLSGLPSPRAAVAGALILVLLPLSGANGVIIALAFSPWIAFVGLRLLGAAPASARPRWPGALLLGAAASAVVVSGVYFVGYERTTWYPPATGILVPAITTAKLLAFGFGPMVSRAWPLAVTLVLALVVSSALLLVRPLAARAGAAVGEPAGRPVGHAEWPRRSGLLVFLAAALGLAFAIAWGRGAAPPAPGWGLPMRYALLNTPMLCACYFVWLLYGPARLRTPVSIALVMIAALLVPLNTRAGFYWRDWYIAKADSVRADVAAGAPPSVIVDRHQGFLMHWNSTLLLSRLEMLQDARLGPFR